MSSFFQQKSVGVALGGGGVRGVAHIPVIETLDGAGVVPAAIAGTSMGAIIGMLYASGMSGQEMRAFMEEHIVTRHDRARDLFAKRSLLMKWLRAVRPSWSRTGLLEAEGFLRYLLQQLAVETFEDLKVPLRIVATDFASGEPLVFDAGPLLPAIKASMSIPGIFVPVIHEGRVLVDGGVSNNLPWNTLTGDCDLILAVDVTPERDPDSTKSPSIMEATMGMFDILTERITKSMMERQPPDLYFNPLLTGVRTLEFDKVEEVLRQTEASLPRLRDALADLQA